MERRRVDRPVDAAGREQGGQCRGETQAAVRGRGQIQRLDAEPVAAEDDSPARGGLDDGEGEHPDQAVDEPLGAEAAIGGEDDLGVRGRPEPLARGLELRPQLAVVVDAAVEDDRQAPVVIHHRLGAGLGEVDDLQPPVDEADPPGDPAAVAIGPARSQGRRHALERGQVRRRPRAGDLPAEAAHSDYRRRALRSDRPATRARAIDPWRRARWRSTSRTERSSARARAARSTSAS